MKKKLLRMKSNTWRIWWVRTRKVQQSTEFNFVLYAFALACTSIRYMCCAHERRVFVVSWFNNSNNQTKLLFSCAREANSHRYIIHHLGLYNTRRDHKNVYTRNEGARRAHSRSTLHTNPIIISNQPISKVVLMVLGCGGTNCYAVRIQMCVAYELAMRNKNTFIHMI